MIVLIACSKTKCNHECPAANMYLGALFCKALQYSITHQYHIYILSAKYGLLTPDQFIQPYDLTLNNMSITDRKIWSSRVINQLKSKNLYQKNMIVFAGKSYHEFLKLPNAVYPLKGLPQGKQLQWFNQKLHRKLYKGFL